MMQAFKNIFSNKIMVSDTIFVTVLESVAANSRIHAEGEFIQHGTTSCLLHSIAVAYYSYNTAILLKGRFFDYNSLIRGALLHDYFLYDWHIPDSSHRLHGFKHPKVALKNARQDFDLTPVEEDIVKNHMFPLTPKLPKHKETFLVSAIDKLCSIYEIFAKKPYIKQKVYSICENIENNN